MNALNKHFMILSLISFQRVSDVSLQKLLPVFHYCSELEAPSPLLFRDSLFYKIN